MAETAEQLAIEAAKKDPCRFAALYEANFDRVYAFIARRVGNRDLAQDLTSEVFLQALAAIPGFEWRGAPLAAWLFRIAANLIADRFKRASREQPLVNLDGDSEPVADGGLQAALEEAERDARLFRLVERLPPDQQRVIVMRFQGDRSVRETARALGRSEGAVKQLQFRALQSLRAWLTEDEAAAGARPAARP